MRECANQFTGPTARADLWISGNGLAMSKMRIREIKAHRVIVLTCFFILQVSFVSKHELYSHNEGSQHEQSLDPNIPDPV